MPRGTALLIAGGACAMLLATGCGSSNRAATASTATVTTASTGATGGTPGAGAQSARSKVVLVGFREVRIVPAAVTAKVGTTVVWVNFDSVEHKLMSLTGPTHFSSPLIAQAHSFRVKLTKPGVIRYVCFIHPSVMRGTIDVVK